MSYQTQSAKEKHWLRRAVRMWGIQTDYIDTNQAAVLTKESTLLALLEGVSGQKIKGVQDLKNLIIQARQQKWARILEPVYVLREGGAKSVAAYFPVGKTKTKAALPFELEFELENGEKRSEKNPVFSLGRQRSFQGQNFSQSFIQVGNNWPIGYHRMHLIQDGKKVASTLLMCAPALLQNPPADKKTWGVFAPLYGLRSERDWGCGDLRDLENFQDAVHQQGASFVGTLPMLASDNRAGAIDPSPYSPVSRLFWNEIYLPIENLAGQSPQVQQRLKDPAFKKEIARLRDLKYVDYEGIWALKKPLLTQLAEEFFINGGENKEAYQEFLKRTPLVEDYARFRSSKQKSEYQYHLYVQFEMDRELKKISERAKRFETAGLYLDFPVGAGRGGFDAAHYARSFFNEVSAGAPPDMLFAGGQNWGFAPLHPVQIREQGYEYFIQCLRRHMSYSRVLRIDHAMAFKRIYAVPQNADAKSGGYLRYRADEFFALLAIEAARSGVHIVGEDLGTVPASMRASLDQNNCLGMWVLPFEAGKQPVFATQSARRTSLACLNTHDMVPFEGYIHSHDIDLFASLGLLDPAAKKTAIAERKESLEVWTLNAGLRDIENLMPVLHKLMAQSPCELFLVNIEDLWRETEPQNVPGTWREFPNWTRKLKLSLEQWTQDKQITTWMKEISQERLAAREIILKKPPLGKKAETAPPAKKALPVTPEIINSDDLYLFNEGRQHRAYLHLGAQLQTIQEKPGAWFSVWAPAVASVSVVGDFNSWDADKNPLRPLGNSGVWSTFVPDVKQDQNYKFRIRTPQGQILEKADPFAFYAETAPKTSSRIRSLEYAWQDQDWMKSRQEKQAMNKAMSIYEMHLGSWRRKPEEANRSLTYRELAAELPAYLKQMNFTHVEFMPLMEHPFYGSWGYQTTSYFAPTSRYGTPQDLMYLIDQLHQAEIGVIMDWVPSHFPEDSFSLGHFNGTQLFEHADPKLGYHPDWKSLIFNYGRHEVRSFLISSALFWLDKYHIDGLRVDAVASMLYLDYSRKAGEWIPNKYGGRENLEAIQFLRELNEAVYRDFPDVHTIAEESTAWPKVSAPTSAGGLGFGMKWDMGWMHDTLEYFKLDPLYRKHHQGQLTFRMVYAFNENFVLSISHDEVVYGKKSVIEKMSGDAWQKFANLRALYAYMYSQPGKKLIFMGSEFGQFAEWNHESSLDWHLAQNGGWNQQLSLLVKDLNGLYKQESALHEMDFSPEGFEWLDASDSANSVLSFFRKSKSGEKILCVFNLTPLPRTNYRLGVSEPGIWQEILNTDAGIYGGSGVGNLGKVRSNPLPLHGRLHSLTLTLPPLAVIYFKYQGGE